MNPLMRLPASVRFLAYALIGVLVLTTVQHASDASGLTSISASQSMLRWAMPILLAGLGGLYAERCGVVNIGLEGMMILGTWFAAWGGINYGPWWGLAIGIFGGALGGLLHAVATITFGVDHIISGVAINVLAPGVTRFLSSEIFDKIDGGSITQSPRVPGIGRVTAPILAGGSFFGWDSPDTLGRIGRWNWFFASDLARLLRGLMTELSLLTVIAVALVPLSAWLLWRTRFGLRLRICGERPEAGESQGIDVYRYKYIGVIISGALAGMGGAFIVSPELSGIYLEGQTTGRGFIGLAALIFGNWIPIGVLGGALLFGYPFGIGLRDLDGSASRALLLLNAIALGCVAVWAARGKRTVDAGIGAGLGVLSLVWYITADSVPDWWTNIFPYVIVLVVLFFFAKRLRPPAASGLRYRRSS